jgi:hypothetical protein
MIARSCKLNVSALDSPLPGHSLSIVVVFVQYVFLILIFRSLSLSLSLSLTHTHYLLPLDHPSVFSNYYNIRHDTRICI